MPQNMGQMIQMLSVLGEMQDRRKQLALDEKKLKQQGEQFAITAGIQKDDARFNRVQSLMKAVAEGGATAQVAVHDLAPLLNFSEQDAQAFAHLAPNASASLQQIQQQQQQFSFDNQRAGMNAMNPERRGQVQQEAALVGQTGQNSGQFGTGQMIGQMAQNAQGQMAASPDLANRYGQAYGAQIAARQTPEQFSTGQAFNDKGMAPAAASIQAGITPSAGQMLGFQGQQMDYYGRLAGQQNQANNISDTVSGLGALHQIAKDLADKKYADKNTKDTMVKQYNAMARLLGTQGVQIPPMVSDADAPSALSRLELWVRAPFGTNAPVSGSIQGGQGGGKGGGGIGTPTGGMRY